MTAEDFVLSFILEKKSFLDECFDSDSTTQTAEILRSLDIDVGQLSIVREMMDVCLHDILYTILLGIDGAASIGNTQHLYKLFDEEGNELTGGDIEAYAWQYFHGKET